MFEKPCLRTLDESGRQVCLSDWRGKTSSIACFVILLWGGALPPFFDWALPGQDAVKAHERDSAAWEDAVGHPYLKDATARTLLPFLKWQRSTAQGGYSRAQWQPTARKMTLTSMVAAHGMSMKHLQWEEDPNNLQIAWLSRWPGR